MKTCSLWVLGAMVLILAHAVVEVNAGGIDDHPWIGDAAPEFALKTLSGDAVALADLKGKYVVIHFGTSW